MCKVTTILIIICIACIIPVVSAERIEIGQGDKVYENETVDISLAASWPDYAVTWCADNDPECDNPKEIIELTGNLHKYWMNPAIFKHFGTYYRWDGEWHTGENQMAFIYVKGTRPTTANLVSGNTLLNTTSNYTQPSGTINPSYGPYKWIVARYDNPEFTTLVNRTDSCHMWLWMQTDEFYNVPVYNENSTYYIRFNASQTEDMKTGKYKAYLQFDGPNGIQDIYYDIGSSAFKSIYNRQIAPEVTLSSALMFTNSSAQFDRYAASIQYYDDVVYPIEMIVEDPTVRVTSVSQNDGKLYISGISSWKANTSLTLKLDPEQYPDPDDARQFVWSTWVQGGVDSYRKFNTALSFDWNDLSIGWHHIDITRTGDPDSPVTTYDFRRSDIYVMPTPTPERVAVLVGMDYSEISAGTSETVAITPDPTETQNSQSVVVLEEDYVLNETTTEPAASHTPGPVKPTPTRDNNIHVPLSPIPGILAIMAILLLFRRGDGNV
ncbi:MAG: hypothetical protein WC455_23990 [Dehalococcoidia bacterium]|jgi:hypothetical protein